MPMLDVDGVDINYVDEGTGPPIVLVHGFASSLQGNWRAPSIIGTLKSAGRRVIALDCRGHGHSDKPHDSDAYAGTKMADDVIALMDHLGVGRADLMGYSMGGALSASLLVRHPERFGCVILAGIGDVLISGRGREWTEGMARAMESKSRGAGESAVAHGFRVFAEATGNDLLALAAMQRAPRRASIQMEQLSNVRQPVLVVLGLMDTLVGSADKVVAAIPGAKFVRVPGDHLTAVVTPELKRVVVDFLAENSPVAAR